MSINRFVLRTRSRYYITHDITFTQEQNAAIVSTSRDTVISISHVVLYIGELSVCFRRCRLDVKSSALRDVPGIRFDGRGNEVEGNKEVIELAVYIALRTRTPCELPR